MSRHSASCLFTHIYLSTLPVQPCINPIYPQSQCCPIAPVGLLLVSLLVSLCWAGSSVADPGCLSRILIFTHSGSRIPDTKTAIKERVKKISCHTFFCSNKFHKIENYFIFGMLKKKNWANCQRIIDLFTQKIVTKLSKIWVWDPGSKIQDPEKTYSESRIQGSTRHRIPNPGPAKLAGSRAVRR